jgi:predicted ArsR family transcriptional regulator
MTAMTIDETATRPPDVSLARLALLADPARSELHRLVRAGEAGLTREEAAAATGISRSLAAFHLDRLAGAGLVTVTYERRTGRAGPGAGRPAKVYRRTAEPLEVAIPPRRYELAAGLFAEAIASHLSGGPAVAQALDDAARTNGAELGSLARKRAGRHPSRAARLEAGRSILEEAGFEPLLRDGNLILRNCPFDALVKAQRDLVCGMNRSLMEGVIEGLALEGFSASFEPRAGSCCVVWTPA